MQVNPTTIEASLALVLAMGLGMVAAAAEPAVARQRISPAAGWIAQVKPEGATPRRADGHPDLTGYWTSEGFGVMDLYKPPGGYGFRGPATLEPDQATLERANLWNKPIYKPQFWKKVHDLDFGKIADDPQFQGLPQGVPRMSAPQKIIQTDKEVVLYHWWGDRVRFIPVDGRSRDPQDSDQETYDGVGLGRWDGDTLVIESTGFNSISWLAWQGYLHSNRMTVTERLRREGDLLYYQFTVDDPEYLEQPWTSDWTIRRLNKDPLARPQESPPWHEQDLDRIPDPYLRG